MSSKHTTASADWRSEYEHQDVKLPEHPDRCEMEDCTREGEPISVVGGAAPDSRVLCGPHAEEFLEVKF